MIVPAVMLVELVAAVCTAFWLKGGTQYQKLRPEAMKQVLDHMVGPNAKSLTSNFSRQMPVSKMPSNAYQSIEIFMPDFDNKLLGRPDL